MNRFSTQGIILRRTNFGEADRILTILTPDHGKLTLMAKGVRRAKAKLAGSTELFSLLEITVLPGKKDIDTLMSARLVRHYGNIIKDQERTNKAYDFIKLIDKNTAEHPEPEYISVLDAALAGLNEARLEPKLTDLWFKLQLLKLSGHAPDLLKDTSGQKLVETEGYNFNPQKMAFEKKTRGRFDSAQIKLVRLAASREKPVELTNILLGGLDFSVYDLAFRKLLSD